jgi:phosphoglycerol transferase MdoB-like AlkP superfamily enzyme
MDKLNPKRIFINLKRGFAFKASMLESEHHKFGFLILPAIFYLSALTYEFILKGFLGGWSARSVFLVFIFSLIWAFIGFLISFLPRLAARITASVFIIVLADVFIIQYILIQIRHIPASLAQANMLRSEVGPVMDTFWKEVHANLPLVITYIIVAAIFIFAVWFFKFGRLRLRSWWCSLILVIGIGALLAGVTELSLRAFGTRFGSPHYLYWRSTDMRAQVRELGLIATETIDIRHVLLGFEPTITAMADPMRRQSPTNEFVPQITFDLLAEAADQSLQHAQISNALALTTPSYTNEFTGVFSGKNMIFIMAESFSPIGVHRELTPTLYKLMNEGFVFDNFYSPHVLSTIGGEFSTLTGLLPTQSILRNWRDHTPTFPLAVGHSFTRAGYNANHAYSLTEGFFYERHQTRDTVGLTNHISCGLGMERYIGAAQCSRWIQSDIQLVDTVLPWISEKALARDEDGNRIPFATYLLTMAGHGEYDGWNNVTTLYRRDVAQLPASLNSRVYVASQMDLDRAVGRLIAALRSIGELDNTVIAIVSDHYPYMLSLDQINELSTFDRDPIIDVNQSPFILWNSKMAAGRLDVGTRGQPRLIDSTVRVDRVGALVDVLPTLLNLWGIPFDSRLMMGRDLLCPVSSGLAVFADRSWVTDYGRFYAATNHFTPRQIDDVPVDLPEDYVNIINQFIASRFNLSESIVQHNYFSALDFGGGGR